MRDELMYMISIRIAKKMYQNKIISKSDLKRLNDILTERHGSYIGKLTSIKDLTK